MPRCSCGKRFTFLSDLSHHQRSCVHVHQEESRKQDDGIVDTMIGVGIGMAIESLFDSDSGSSSSSSDSFSGGGGDFGGGGSSGDW
jgi:uncharacterized protein